MGTDFTLSVESGADRTIVKCAGELDGSAVSKFNDAVDTALTDRPRELTIDCREVTLLSAAGIRALLTTLDLCRASHVQFKLEVEEHPRRVLDLVGLWWLGVIDDGGEVEAKLQEAMANYSEFYDDHGMGDGVADDEVVD